MPLVGNTLIKRADIQGGRFVENLLIDIKSDPLADPRRTRFHELRTAWNSIKEAPVFGLGPSGRFKVYDPTGLEYHRGRYDFVHSGFGHLLLKGGFFGLALFCGLILSWCGYVRRHWASIQGPTKALTVASLAGLAASLPNMFFGAPIGDLRGMLLMGLLLALPLAAARVSRAHPAPQIKVKLPTQYHTMLQPSAYR